MTQTETTIPQELRALAQWVVYRAEPNSDGKTTKRPYQPAATRTLASSTNRATWGTFDAATDASERDRSLHGVGFVFSADDPFLGVDLDHCIVDGVISSRAQHIIDLLDSYAEYSHSGDGVHIIVSAWLDRGRKNSRIEMYSSGRYFTMSGRHVHGTPLTINPRQPQVDQLAAEFFPNEPDPQPTPTRPNTLADSELLNRAYQFKNGAAFRALYEHGDKTPYAGDDSAADLALCNHLAFVTGNDPQRIDSLFRQSALYRKKWDERHGERTYGQMTIDKATSATRETYSPPGEPYRVSDDSFGRNGYSAEPDVDPETGEIRSLAGRVLLNQALTEGVPPPDWLVEGCLVYGFVHLLYGESGHGKTTVALRWVEECLALGLPVVFVDEESGHTKIAGLLHDMGLREVDHLLHYFPMAGITIDDSAALFDYCDQVQPALILFDSLTDFMSISGIDDNNSVEVNNWFKKLAMPLVLRDYRPCLLLIDHVTKAKDNVSHSAGSRAKRQKSGVLWHVEKTEEFDRTRLGKVVLTNWKNNPGVMPDKHTFVVGTQDGRLICEPYNATEHGATAMHPKAEKFLSAINDAPRTNAELRAILGVEHDSVVRIANDLIKRGMVERVGEGRFVTYRSCVRSDAGYDA